MPFETYKNALLPRHIEPLLNEALSTARVVNLVGPRQTGKTTLVRDLLAEGRFVTLDDDATRVSIELDPLGQLSTLRTAAGNSPVIIDEAQRLPSLALAVKQIVDADRQPGQFLLTGSSNVFTTLAVVDSLAGRLSTCRLWPLTTAEIFRRPASSLLDWAVGKSPDLSELPAVDVLTRQQYAELMVCGGYPEMHTLAFRPRRARLRAYMDTLVDRDVADVLEVRRTDALRRLIDQLAVRTSSVLNVSELAALVGAQRGTIDQWMDVLERLAVIKRVSAWASGETRREAGRPKVHFVDTGIATALRDLNADSFEPDADPTAFGGLLESFVVNEVLRASELQENVFSVWHWTGASKREIDLIVESRNRLVAIEIKASTSITKADLKHINWFATVGPGARRQVTSILFYLGKEAVTLGPRTFGLPVSMLWA